MWTRFVSRVREYGLVSRRRAGNGVCESGGIRIGCEDGGIRRFFPFLWFFLAFSMDALWSVKAMQPVFKGNAGGLRGGTGGGSGRFGWFRRVAEAVIQRAA